MYQRLLALLIVIVLGVFGGALFYTSKTMSDLFGENKQLKEALSNLKAEEQVGFAKVTRQFRDESGKLFTTLKFVTTYPGDPLKKVLEKSYTIEGDVIHFDALIVKFPDRLVESGEEKAIYLWRRIYGDYQTPSAGYPIESFGDAPARYKEVFNILGERRSLLFWQQIWDLADNPESLKDKGIEAIYGNVVYRRLKPGLIYVFKIKSTGQLYPEVVPDL